MRKARPERLLARAWRAGVHTVYRDLMGRERRADPRTLAEILRAVAGPDEQAGTERELEGPTSTSRSRYVGVWTVPLGVPARVRVARAGSPPVFEARLRPEGQHAWRRLRVGRGERIELPGDLPAGAHEVRLRRRSRTDLGKIVVAPVRLAPPRAGWGVFAPVYAIRDVGTWGCGDLTALERVGRWAGSRGATVLSTLPLLPAFLDRPFDPSPYRPVSRRFWNELYLDPRRTPEFRRSARARRWVRSPSFGRRVAALERRTYVDFRAVARLKRSVLERMLRDFDRAPRSRREAFRRFVRRTDGVDGYARYRASFEPDPRWGERYHLFVQWLTGEQVAGVARRLRRRGVELYLDLPLGVHPLGYDAAEDPSLFASSVTLGSPPDPGVPGGQDWGFQPWRPGALRAEGFRPWSETLAHHLSVARLLRIDHALGLHRLFWIPTGRVPGQGVYVRSPARDLYAILRAEAFRAGASIVGEDLGTVPPGLRSSLRRNGFLRLFVAQLEWAGSGPRRRIPFDSVASLNTHDHVPFADFWRSRAPGTNDGFHTPRTARSAGGTPDAMSAFRHATLRLARSPARIFLVNLEDLWGETRPQNTPGRSGPTMFSRRWSRTLPALRRDPRARELLCAIDALRRRRYDRWRRPTSGSGEGRRAVRRRRRRLS